MLRSNFLLGTKYMILLLNKESFYFIFNVNLYFLSSIVFIPPPQVLSYKSYV